MSFATLIETADAPFLAERFDLGYVASGRDLLRTLSAPKGEDFVVFADPDFSSPPAAEPKAPGSLHHSTIPEGPVGDVDGEFRELGGTQAEYQQLKRFADARHWTLQSRLGRAATKAALAAVRSPRILHLATHGYFFSDAASSDRTPLIPAAELAAAFQNPMRRSGLALAGANLTLNSWRHGKPTLPADNDGFVTAEDVATLNLKGTELVVLSVCETGRGKLMAGGGVLGLRRGFAQADAQMLLLSLWRIGTSLPQR